MGFEYKDLLLNVFIIMLPLVFYRFVYTAKHPIAAYLLFIGPLLFTMTFPVRMFSTLLDLRGIPLVVGSLYGGPYTAVLLFCSLLVYRELFGGVHVIYYLAALLPTFILIMFVLRKFNNKSVRSKMLIVFGICCFLRATVVIIYYTLEGRADFFMKTFVPSVPVILAQSLLAVICVYIIESIRNTINLREEVVHAEKMKIVSEIAASVAHEVRNPLTTVRGFIQLLGDPSIPDNKRTEYSAICLEELSRAQSIISDYLSLAKPGQEKREPVRLDKELQYVCSILSSYANYQNVEIHGNFDIPLSIFGNQTRFRQALINIGKNAIEAMPDGGKLEYEVIYEKDGTAKIRISDTGIGMTKEQVGRLGTLFYSTKDKGTGLGTMVTFNIIRDLGGSIEVKSKVGHGTQYILTLPVIANSGSTFEVEQQ